MGVEQWAGGGMSGKLFSKDPYLSAIGNDSLLFSTSATTNNTSAYYYYYY